MFGSARCFGVVIYKCILVKLVMIVIRVARLVHLYAEIKNVTTISGYTLDKVLHVSHFWKNIFQNCYKQIKVHRTKKIE